MAFPDRESLEALRQSLHPLAEVVTRCHGTHVLENVADPESIHERINKTTGPPTCVLTSIADKQLHSIGPLEAPCYNGPRTRSRGWVRGTGGCWTAVIALVWGRNGRSDWAHVTPERVSDGER